MFFLFIFLNLIVILFTAKIQIKIENFKYDTEFIKLTKTTSNINEKYNIQIRLLILNIIPIIWLNINSKKIDKMKKNQMLKKVDFNKVNKEMSNTKMKQASKKIDIKIKKFYLNANIGTESMAVTTFAIIAISSFVSILFLKKKVKPQYIKYNIKPIYNRGNKLYIDFSGIFEVKLIHIIKVICII